MPPDTRHQEASEPRWLDTYKATSKSIPGIETAIFHVVLSTLDSTKQMYFPPLHLHLHRSPPVPTTRASGLVEIILASACSLVAAYHATQKEAVNTPVGLRTPFGVIQPPPTSRNPGLLLLSCLGLGCCVSSYTHRTREREPYQGTIFLIWIIGVGLVGLVAASEAETVLAGMIPSALTAAMLSSYFGHAGARWLLSRRGAGVATLIPEEKGPRFH